MTAVAREPAPESPGEVERTLRARLHPAAGDLIVTVGEAGRVTATAVTAPVGPGYHTFVGQLLRRLGADLSISWAASDPETGDGDPTGYFDSGQRPDAERHLLIWLRGALQRASDARARGGGPVDLGDFGGDRFTVDGAIATALGPRDDAWIGAAVQDPAVAIEAWPWWADATDARYLLNRALCLMWTDIRWRPPATDDEHAAVNEALRLLRKAFPLDPSLPYPWREWKELLDLSGQSDPMTERVTSEAVAVPDEPLIGYRRQPVTVLHGGWAVTIPGSFAEHRTTEEWSAGEGGRSITLAAVETGTDHGPMPPEAFLEQVAGHLGDDVLRHRENGLIGKARLAVDPLSEVDVAVLEGYSAVRGSGAAIRIVIHDPEDWEWALDMWRSVRPI